MLVMPRQNQIQSFVMTCVPKHNHSTFVVLNCDLILNAQWSLAVEYSMVLSSIGVSIFLETRL
jgi:hypothetical protein